MLRKHALFLLTAVVLPLTAQADGVLDVSGLGKTAEACTDFDEYVNGLWRTTTPMRADRARMGSFDDVRDDSQRVVAQALADAAKNPAALDTPGKRLAATFYVSGMNLAAVEQRGLASLQPLLAQIDALDDRAKLPAVVAALARVGVDAPVRVAIMPDAKDRRRYIFNIDQGGLGLPDRDDYFKSDARTQQLKSAYAAYRLQLATLSRAKDPTADAAASLALQQPLAEASATRVARRDPTAVYQLHTPKSLAALAPGFDWPAFFAAAGAPDVAEFNVASPAFMTAFAKAAADAPLPAWRAYLRERLLDEVSPTLPAAFVDARFAYRGKAIRGLQQNVNRQEQVISLMTGPFGSEPLAEGLGQLYVARAFTPEAKAAALQMIGDIRAALRTRIAKLDWMSAPTKAAALAKLDAMSLKIGYPDQWKEYKGLVITADDYSGNFLRARAWASDDRLAELPKPVDRNRWFASPHLVNAFAGGLNEIIFPAAILQPPFFNPKADPAVNYGAIGAVIGHEITHHFDDRGRQFDGVGNLNDWWTPDDAAAYKKRAAAVASQFSAFEPVPGQRIIGEQTLGENISDLGGINIAYDGLQLALARKPVGLIDGLTQAQRFFISFAIIWRNQQRTESLLDQLRTGQHSPGRWRVLGPLANLSTFEAAFSCPKGAPMLRAPADRIVIW